MLRKVLGLWLALTLWSAPAVLAQELRLPPPSSALVSDLAEVLDPAIEARLARTLGGLRLDHGTDFRVVTLATRSAYSYSGSDEGFASALFRSRSIGADVDGNGVLLLVLVEDRFARIELGNAYGQRFDFAARAIMNDVLVPAFAAGDYQDGIVDGVAAITDRIVTGPPPSNRVPLGLYLFFAVFAGLFGLPYLAEPLRRRQLRRRRCPTCNERALAYHEQVVRQPSAKLAGSGDRFWQCRHCGWSGKESYSFGRPTTAPLGTRQGSRGFRGGGGGRSGGGGASGRW